MSPFEGWAAALNGVVFTGGCCNAITIDVDEQIITNEVPNPSFEVDLEHWAASNAVESTVTRTGDESYAGSFSVEVEATATTAADLGIELDTPDDFVTVVENDDVWGSGLFLPGTGTDAEATIHFYDADDVLISSVTGSTMTLSVGEFSRAWVNAVAPAGAVNAQLSLNFVGGATNGDLVGWIDAAMFAVGDVLDDYFDGNSLDTTIFGYEWDGDENDSASSRIPCYLISGSTILECLTSTPDGLGLPPQRTEDQTYTQRHGVRHFKDWYGPRLITLVGTLGPSPCDNCITVREQLMLAIQAWKLQCEDVELVLYPPCEAGEDIAQRVITGPYGIVGRPRVFDYKWIPHKEQVVDFVARFDANDHRFFVLDPCGTPGLQECIDIPPGVSQTCVTVPFCLTDGQLCLTEEVEDDVEPTDVTIEGTECVSPTITLFPGLDHPRVENLTTGEAIGYNQIVTDDPVIINTEDGTAFQNGESVTHLLTGSLKFRMAPGDYSIRLLTQSDSDDGYAQLCYRPTVLMA